MSLHKTLKQFIVILGVLTALLGCNTALAQRAKVLPDNLSNQLILPHSNSSTPETDFGGRLLPTITTIIISASGGASVLFIIIGAVEMLTAYGNDEKISKGKQTITYAIIGLVVALLSYAIVTIISSIDLNPAPAPK